MHMTSEGMKRSYEKAEDMIGRARRCRNLAKAWEEKARRAAYYSGVFRRLIDQAGEFHQEADYWYLIARLRRTTVYQATVQNHTYWFFGFQDLDGRRLSVSLGRVDELTEQEALDMAVAIKAAVLGITPPYDPDGELELKYNVKVVKIKKRQKAKEAKAGK